MTRARACNSSTRNLRPRYGLGGQTLMRWMRAYQDRIGHPSARRDHPHERVVHSRACARTALAAIHQDHRRSSDVALQVTNLLKAVKPGKRLTIRECDKAFRRQAHVSARALAAHSSTSRKIFSCGDSSSNRCLTCDAHVPRSKRERATQSASGRALSPAAAHNAHLVLSGAPHAAVGDKIEKQQAFARAMVAKHAHTHTA